MKFKQIGVPQPEDVIRASSKSILKTLDSVNLDVLPLFKDAALALIESSGGDAEKALCKALAFMSGHYKQKFASRSLLNGQEKQITLQLNLLEGSFQNPIKNGVELIRNYFPTTMADRLRLIRGLKSMNGIVFDIDEDQADRFLEIAQHLKETDSKIDFQVNKCLELPQMEDADGGPAWRGGGGGSFSG